MRQTIWLKTILVTAILLAILITGVILVQSLDTGTKTGLEEPPSILEYTFRKITVNNNETTIIPLFNRPITPVKTMISIWESYYCDTPRFILGVYSEEDYAILLTGDLKLEIVRNEVNSTGYEYTIRLLMYNNTLMYFSPIDNEQLHNGVLSKISMDEPFTQKGNMDGKIVNIYVTKRIVLETHVWISAEDWEYNDGKDYYGTWYFFIPEKPFAILMPILYINTEPGKMLGSIFLLKDNYNNNANPIQPSLIGENTKQLLEIVSEKGWDWIKKDNESIKLVYKGKEVIPFSLAIPYQLVYDEDNVLKEIKLTEKLYDWPYKLSLNKINQIDNSLLIPAPLIKEVGRLIVIAPFNDNNAMLELELTYKK